jgi:hypothetical protein
VIRDVLFFTQQNAQKIRDGRNIAYEQRNKETNPLK